eukprot:CAMPEP_0175641688 /NCGR_PEP_ID=MMETSP0097-20121207/4886_1 /TAXON_ID=311494 /ORGANISM="Alexandrium monilatum, Strain CCMP3105" /LENGTH=290 /DNA_ID=CAMNT_0016947465 /DNA_START=163 /DNA_END=1030 /DNA_ORIENTATION=+
MQPAQSCSPPPAAPQCAQAAGAGAAGAAADAPGAHGRLAVAAGGEGVAASIPGTVQPPAPVRTLPSTCSPPSGKSSRGKSSNSPSGSGPGGNDASSCAASALHRHDQRFPSPPAASSEAGAEVEDAAPPARVAAEETASEAGGLEVRGDALVAGQQWAEPHALGGLNRRPARQQEQQVARDAVPCAQLATADLEPTLLAVAEENRSADGADDDCAAPAVVHENLRGVVQKEDLAILTAIQREVQASYFAGQLHEALPPPVPELEPGGGPPWRAAWRVVSTGAQRPGLEAA